MIDMYLWELRSDRIRTVEKRSDQVHLSIRSGLAGAYILNPACVQHSVLVIRTNTEVVQPDPSAHLIHRLIQLRQYQNFG